MRCDESTRCLPAAVRGSAHSRSLRDDVLHRTRGKPTSHLHMLVTRQGPPCTRRSTPHIATCRSRSEQSASARRNSYGVTTRYDCLQYWLLSSREGWHFDIRLHP